MVFGTPFWLLLQYGIIFYQIIPELSNWRPLFEQVANGVLLKKGKMVFHRVMLG